MNSEIINTPSFDKNGDFDKIGDLAVTLFLIELIYFFLGFFTEKASKMVWAAKACALKLLKSREGLKITRKNRQAYFLWVNNFTIAVIAEVLDMNATNVNRAIREMKSVRVALCYVWNFLVERDL